jgi:CPA2 family monovalent cation:H+ antiporter-2
LNVTSKFLYPIAVAVSAITTLLTPYLIKSSDWVVNWFDRLAPRAIVNYLEVYTDWVGQLGSQRQGSMAADLARRWAWQMALNAVLIAAVFVGAVFVGQRPPAWLVNLGFSDEMLKAGLWLAAVILCLPMFIATFRKLQALGLLTAEAKVSQAAAGERTAAIRAIVAQAIPVAGSIALGLFVLVLSSALLPRFSVLIALVTIAAAIGWLLWRTFIRVYSKAQVALQETFQQAPASPHEPPAPTLPPLLREANLEMMKVETGSPAAGKYIGELGLRSRTGASIVGIQRNGTRIINPGPDEELQAGDEILLLGTRTQLDAAKSALVTRL